MEVRKVKKEILFGYKVTGLVVGEDNKKLWGKSFLRRFIYLV